MNELQRALDVLKRRKKMSNYDPDVEQNIDSSDTRLVPLDKWERAWIRGAVGHAIALQEVVPPTAADARRMSDLLRKVGGIGAVMPPEPN